MRTIQEFPQTLQQDEEIEFEYEGVATRARVQYVHVFYEPSALAEHLRLTKLGLYDGFQILDNTEPHQE